MWEVTGAEFTNHGVHTADGISIRFPRVTRIRRDKDWSNATTLNELRELFRKRPESVDISLLLGVSDESDRKPSNLLDTSMSSEPSTSYVNHTVKIKKEPSGITEELPKERKRDRDADDGAKSPRKKSKAMKRDIKEEPEKKQRKEETVKKEEKRKDCPLEETNAKESLARETNSFDSDVEDNVSNISSMP